MVALSVILISGYLRDREARGQRALICALGTDLVTYLFFCLMLSDAEFGDRRICQQFQLLRDYYSSLEELVA